MKIKLQDFIIMGWASQNAISDLCVSILMGMGRFDIKTDHKSDFQMQLKPVY